MSIQMIGIDHSVAKIDIRMMFSFTKKAMAEAYQQLKQQTGIRGSVILSTCNRMELWMSTDDDFLCDPVELLCSIRQLPSEEYRPYFSVRTEREAIDHLFCLASGLESRILGEDQIITQVGEALSFSREHYATDHILETLFRQAVTAAKKIKTSGIELSPADQSVVHTAIDTLRHEGFDFAGKKCLVIGNGVMGKLAATLLREQGADVTVTVRQYRSGVVQIPKDCARIDYGRRMELFGQCDLVVSATVSPNYTLTKEQVAEECSHPVVLIDLAVPRDIDPRVKEIPEVRLYDIDCFRAEAHSEAQKQAIQRAKESFGEQIADFYSWYECSDLIPHIQKIKEQAAEDLTLRLVKKLQKLPLSEKERAVLRGDIHAAAVKTINKMLFGLRDGAALGTFRECLDVLEKLYGDEQRD